MARRRAPDPQRGPRVALSFGIGRLHFVQAAEALTARGVDLDVVQGWVPQALSSETIDRLGRMLGSPHLSVGMRKRRLSFLSGGRNISLAAPEVLTQALFQVQRRIGPLGRAIGLTRGQAARIGWQAFGRATARQLAGPLADREIFHCRSGAGFAAIAEARARGMAVIVDHSIAHPAFLERVLKPECAAAGQPFWIAPDDPFWRQVLDDCLAADLLLVNSDFVKRSFVEQGMDPDRIAVIYLGVRDDFGGLKQDYATGDRLELLFTGQFGVRKGARHLLAALERLVAEGRDVHLTALGDASEAREMVAASPVASRVTLPGFVPQDRLRDYLARADLYVFPSLAEGCASSAMEALAAGLPVVATAETGLPARHDAEAWIVPPADPEALARGIATLADDPARRARLGRAATAMMAQGFTWEDYGRTLAGLYDRVLADRRAAA